MLISCKWMGVRGNGGSCADNEKGTGGTGGRGARERAAQWPFREAAQQRQPGAVTDSAPFPGPPPREPLVAPRRRPLRHRAPPTIPPQLPPGPRASPKTLLYYPRWAQHLAPLVGAHSSPRPLSHCRWSPTDHR
jgi:hypothetical protein